MPGRGRAARLLAVPDRVGDARVGQGLRRPEAACGRSRVPRQPGRRHGHRCPHLSISRRKAALRVLNGFDIDLGANQTRLARRPDRGTPRRGPMGRPLLRRPLGRCLPGTPPTPARHSHRDLPRRPARGRPCDFTDDELTGHWADVRTARQSHRADLPALPAQPRHLRQRRATRPDPHSPPIPRRSSTRPPAARLGIPERPHPEPPATRKPDRTAAPLPPCQRDLNPLRSPSLGLTKTWGHPPRRNPPVPPTILP